MPAPETPEDAAADLMHGQLLDAGDGLSFGVIDARKTALVVIVQKDGTTRFITAYDKAWTAETLRRLADSCEDGQ